MSNTASYLVVVASAMRCGSTTITCLCQDVLKRRDIKAVLTKATPSSNLYQRVKNKIVNWAYQHGNNVVFKTHRFSASRHLDVIQQWPALKVVVPYRDLPPSIVSRILYARNVRTNRGLPNPPTVSEFIKRNHHLSDSEFVNSFILDCPATENLVKGWGWHSIPISHPQVLELAFASFAGSNIDRMSAAVRRIADFFDMELSDENVNRIASRHLFGEARKRQGAGFMRFGAEGGNWMLTPESLQQLNRIARQLGISPNRTKSSGFDACPGTYQARFALIDGLSVPFVNSPDYAAHQ